MTLVQEQKNISHSKTIIYLSQQINEKRILALDFNILIFLKNLFLLNNVTYTFSKPINKNK